jgi:hypothetical protein
VDSTPDGLVAEPNTTAPVYASRLKYLSRDVLEPSFARCPLPASRGQLDKFVLNPLNPFHSQLQLQVQFAEPSDRDAPSNALEATMIGII